MSDADRSLETFNRMQIENAICEMERCCGAKAWCQAIVVQRPFGDLNAMHVAADVVFDGLGQSDWLEAYSHHPKIGDIQSLMMKYAGNRDWSAGEQAGISETDELTIKSLADGNAAYEKKFGFIFIVCAAGKSAGEMLALLQARLPLDRDAEIRNAAIEQRKITHVRIDKWRIQA